MNEKKSDEQPAEPNNATSEKALILHEQDGQALIIHGTENEPRGINVIKKVDPGKPIYGEAITLNKRADGFYTMERMKVPTPAGNRASHGPAMVASPEYRDNGIASSKGVSTNGRVSYHWQPHQ